MNQPLYTRDDVGRIIDQLDREKNARLAFQATDRPQTVFTSVIDLSTARDRTQALKVGSQFRSLFVASATDVLCNVNIVIGSNETFQDSIPLVFNASLALDYATDQAWLFWDAQPGKTLTIKYFVNLEYRSGTQISVTSGGVSVSEGSALTGPTRTVLVATTAAIIAPALSTRKTCMIQNNTGADLWIGGSTVTNAGATQGIKLADGVIYEYRNTAALYAYSVGGGDVTRLEYA